MAEHRAEPAHTLADVATLTRGEREARVERLIREADQIYLRAIDQHVLRDGRDLAASVVLFSGGNDSTVLAHLVDNLRWDTRSANVLDQVRHGTHVQARKTHCPRNHPYDEQNTYRNNQGRRECRACHREAQAARRARRRQAVAA